MHRFFLQFLFCLLPLFQLQAFDLEVDAVSALLVNAETGAVLYEKEPDKLLPPASTIKIATALYILEQKGDKLDEMVIADAESLRRIAPSKKRKGQYKMPAYWLETDVVNVGIQTGERLSLRDLLQLHLVKSAGDASNVMARHVGGSIPRFIEELNAYLQSIGCRDTVVLNPHGLHHPDQVSTARDLAIITQRALQNPTFCAIVSKASVTVPETNKSPERSVRNGNALVRRGRHYYPKAIGGKTGYHSHVRFNLVSAAEYDGRRLIAVLLREEDRNQRFKDSIRLFETAFKEQARYRRVLKKGPIKITRHIPESNGLLKAALNDDAYIRYYPSERPSKLKARVEWTEQPLPVEAGTEIGILFLENDAGYAYAKVPLYAEKRVNWSLSHRLTDFAEANRTALLFFGIASLIFGLVYWRAKA